MLSRTQMFRCFKQPGIPLQERVQTGRLQVERLVSRVRVRVEFPRRVRGSQQPVLRSEFRLGFIIFQQISCRVLGKVRVLGEYSTPVRGSQQKDLRIRQGKKSWGSVGCQWCDQARGRDEGREGREREDGRGREGEQGGDARARERMRVGKSARELERKRERDRDGGGGERARERERGKEGGAFG